MKNCLRTRLARGLEHLLFWVTQREKGWRRIEEEKNPFGKVDADRWEWRQAGQSATEEGCVCRWVSVMCLNARACLCLPGWGVPDYFSLIDPAQHPSDLQDVSELSRCWWRWRNGEREKEREREKTRKKERGERKIKINSVESITGNLTDRGTEVVKSY